jgi:hypothetical protein
MRALRKITIEAAPEPLERAQKAQTVRTGLEILAASQAYELRQLRNTVQFTGTGEELRGDR